MIWFAGILVSLISFIAGRILNQSESVLSDKRRVYEAFLETYPAPNEAYLDWSDQVESDRLARINRANAPLLLYASKDVLQAISLYSELFATADDELNSGSPALHPTYKELALAHNDIALEMRRDALSWSVFGHRGPSRLPKNGQLEVKGLLK